MLLYLIYALYHKVACKRLISIEILLFDVLALLKYCWKNYIHDQSTYASRYFVPPLGFGSSTNNTEAWNVLPFQITFANVTWNGRTFHASVLLVEDPKTNGRTKYRLAYFRMFLTLHCDVIMHHKTTKCTIFYINIYFLMCTTCFEPRGFLLRKAVIYAVCYVYIHRCEQSGG